MTPKERAAMQLALEALESCALVFTESDDIDEAITALREVLAEPVRKCDGLFCNDCGEYKQKYKDLPGLTEKDLCVCEQAEQEPVAYVYEKDVAGIGMRKDVAFTKHVEVGTDLYAAPVRTKDLTDDEMEKAWGSKRDTHNWHQCVRAVIAADRSKNK